MQEQEFKYKSRVTEILPNTERVKQRLAKQKQAEKLRQQELDKAKHQREQQEKLKMQMQMQQQQKQEEQKKRQEEVEKKKREETALISTLQGKFGNMIQNLKSNNTNLDYTISGLQLKDAQVRILVKAVENNQSLKGLTFSRKGINDQEGQEIVNSVITNKTLERLEVEGNLLGIETCKAIRDLLRSNTTLKVIDLEGNHLLHSQKMGNQSSSEGIEELCKGLAVNQTLLCLNLANTGLDKDCSQFLMNMLEQNHTLIQLDIDANPKMDIHNVRQIQASLTRNKTAFDQERYQEFLERKQMWREQNISQILTQNIESKKVLTENINTRIEAKRQELEQNWQKKIENEEMLRQKQIIRLEKEAQIKKKGKKGRKKKKKQ